MAGKRKAEGIALLSLYNDDGDEEDEDEESEDEDEDTEQKQEIANERDLESIQDQTSASEAPPPAEAAPEDREPVPGHEAAARYHNDAVPKNQGRSPRVGGDRTGNGAHGIIVDYAHDESTLSPDAQEGEGISVGKALYGADMQMQVDNDVNLDEAKVTHSTDEIPSAPDAEVLDAMETSDIDPLADFLPPPSAEKCSDELQQKFARYLALKNAGRSFNEELRKSKGYRNPDFLQRAVKYQEIDQIGSCFKKEIFDPHGYDASDFYDALALEFRREQERKEQAKKQNQRIDFVHGGVQAQPVPAIPDKSKLLLPVAGATAVNSLQSVTSASQGVSSATETAPKPDTGRTNKKSKWDKVDNDSRPAQSIPPVAKSAIAAASAHTVLLTANAGGGYASFAQQKRKEVEERSRGSDKRSDRK